LKTGLSETKDRAGGPAIALIAIDLDGTLIDAHNQLFPGAEQSVQSALACGVEIVLVSGRSMQGVLPIVNRLGLESPFISSGGAVIAQAYDSRLIDHRPLPLRYLPTIVRLGRSKEVAVFLEYPDRILCEAQGQKQESETRKFGYSLIVVDDLIHDTPAAPNKVTLVGDTQQIIGIEELLTDRGLPLHITRTGPHYLDICRKGVNKGSALQRLARYLKLPLKRVAAVGDYYNDIAMFKVAGLAVAMGDAPPEVQKAARLVAPPSDRGGAAWAINRLIGFSTDLIQAG
jgi:hypothetical protein